MIEKLNTALDKTKVEDKDRQHSVQEAAVWFVYIQASLPQRRMLCQQRESKQRYEPAWARRCNWLSTSNWPLAGINGIYAEMLKADVIYWFDPKQDVLEGFAGTRR